MVTAALNSVTDLVADARSSCDQMFLGLVSNYSVCILGNTYGGLLFGYTAISSPTFFDQIRFTPPVNNSVGRKFSDVGEPTIGVNLPQNKYLHR